MIERALHCTEGHSTSVTSRNGTNPLIVNNEDAMKNIQDVLREKEAEIEKLNREIKLLRVAARLLDEEGQNQTVRTMDPIQRHVETAAMSIEEPVLDVLPAAGPANGDANKRWP